MYNSVINRYLFKNLCQLAIYYTIVPTIIIWVVQSKNILDLAIGGSVSIGLILKLSLYLIPQILPHIIPFSILLTILTVISRLYNGNELTTIFASGISPAKLQKSFILFGIITTIFVFSLNFYFVSLASKQFKRTFFEVKNDLVQNIIKPGTVQKPTEDLIIYIQNITANSYLEGFYLEDYSSDMEIRIFTAEQALLQENIIKEENNQFELLLLKGRLLYWPLTSNSNTRIKKEKYGASPMLIEFDKFSINLSELIKHINMNEQVQFKTGDYSVAELLSGDIAKSEAEARKLFIRGHNYIITSFLPSMFVAIVIFIMMYPLQPRSFPYQLILTSTAFCIFIRILLLILNNLASNYYVTIYFSYILTVIILVGSFLFVKKYRNNKI